MRKKKILVIDDEEVLRHNVCYMFKVKGYEAEGASDGLDALEKLKTYTPDLIILDLNMPRMDGIEFYKNLRGSNEKTPIPVLVLTARANMESLFRDLDVDGFMPKPFEIDDLLRESETILRKNIGRILIEESEEHRAARVLIVEDSDELLKKISFVLLSSGFIINAARSGASAMVSVKLDVPDLMLIKMKLKDISGDVVIAKLKQRSDSQNIKCVLYGADVAVDSAIIQKIGEKFDHCLWVPSNDVNEILIKMDDILHRE